MSSLERLQCACALLRLLIARVKRIGRFNREYIIINIRGAYSFKFIIIIGNFAKVLYCGLANKFEFSFVKNFSIMGTRSAAAIWAVRDCLPREEFLI